MVSVPLLQASFGGFVWWNVGAVPFRNHWSQDGVFWQLWMVSICNIFSDECSALSQEDTDLGQLIHCIFACDWFWYSSHNVCEPEPNTEVLLHAIGSSAHGLFMFVWFVSESGQFSADHSCEANLLLFKTVVAGDSWGQIAVPVIQENPGTLVIFIGSLVTLVFGVLNVAWQQLGSFSRFLY